jgi:DNA polymerase mu
MIELAYPYIITHETFERDIRTLIGLGDKTLFKVIAPSYLAVNLFVTCV